MAAGSDPFHHVRDTSTWELPGFVLELLGRNSQFVMPSPLTKYMVLQVVAVCLAFLIFRGLATRVAGGQPVKGLWWNFWESLAVFIRDEVVRPSIGIPHQHAGPAEGAGELGHSDSPALSVDSHHSGGHPQHQHSGQVSYDIALGHPADRYLPFVWSVFFYILICNLLGAIPFLGSPTADINVTGVLAVITFVHVVFYGSQQSGIVGFWKSLVPGMDLPPLIAVVLLPVIWLIEAGGLLIKHGVLAVRLFANIMAGHTVLGVFLGFIALANGPLWGIVMPASIFGQVAIGMLELFVAFLQAYVFSLLASLFISAAVNPH